MALSSPPELGFNDFLAMLFEPVSITTKLTQLFLSITREKKLGPEGSPITDPTLYRSLAGLLEYLTFTRPDLSYAVRQLCLYMHDPREPHLNTMKRDTLSRSSAEAEYRGVANVVAETSWIRNLLRELYTPLFTAILVYCDNVSVVYMGVAAKGGTNVCLRKTTVEEMYMCISDHKVTHMCCAPVVLNILIEAKPHERREITSKINILTRGAPPPAALLETMEDLGFHVMHAYGLTEATGPALVCEWQTKWNQLLKDHQARLKAHQGV
ncbi:butyrate--CoA ligase AAE11, peroxisomal-like protein, partial [Tanacetum coccineum]